MTDDEATAREVLRRARGPRPHADDLAVVTERERARALPAMGALGVMALLAVVTGVLSFRLSGLMNGAAGAQRAVLDAARQLVSFGTVTMLAHGVTAVLFLRWLREAVRNARHIELVPMTEPPLEYDASQATWAWFIPFLNLARPYRVMKGLRRVSAPELLPGFTTEVAVEGAGYREAATEAVRHEAPAVPVPLFLWWALFLGSAVFERVITIFSPISGNDFVLWGQLMVASSAIDMSAALAALLLVRSIDRNRAELNRRLAHWVEVVDD